MAVKSLHHIHFSVESLTKVEDENCILDKLSELKSDICVVISDSHRNSRKVKFNYKRL